MDNPFLSAQLLQLRLSEAGIASVVIGGVAVGAWGEPRLTRDADFKVALGRGDAEHLYKLIATRPRDREDAAGVVRRQGDSLDHAYVETWLRQFERALDDSTLVAAYRQLRRKYGSIRQL